MTSDPLGSDLSAFTLPADFFHQSQRGDGPPKTDRYGIDLTTPPRRWEEWIVKLEFKKLGQGKHGNGFLVNVPSTKYEVIFTAGHNLVDAPRQHCTDIRIITATGEIPVSPDMTRVCQRYFEEPDELNAIYDYGIILLRRGPKQPRRGFGFSLMLGVAPPLRDNARVASEGEDKDVLQDRMLYVSGYRPVSTDSPSKGPPRRSEGCCISASTHQLFYTARTEEGISGGPVWLGFRGTETVVAIHNYRGNKDGTKNKGSRMDLDFWRTVFGWLDLGWTHKSLHHRTSSSYSMHLHLRLTPGTASRRATGEGRVRVGLPGRVDTLFDVLPVSAYPNDKKVSDACWSFLLCETGASAPRWVRWDATKQKVSLTDRPDALCEVKLLNVVAQPTQPFDIQARQDGKGWKDVRMGMSLLDEGDLELLAEDPQSFEDTSEISFITICKARPFELK